MRKRKGITLVLFLLVALTPLAGFFGSFWFSNYFSVAVLTILFTVLGYLEGEQLKGQRYLGIGLFLFLISLLISTAVLRTLAGYIIFFYLLAAFNFGASLVLGFAAIKSFYFLSKRLAFSSSQANWIFYFSIGISILILGLAGTFRSITINQINKENLNKTEAIKRLGKLIKSGKTEVITNETAIQAGVVNGIYKVEGNNIYHTFGGKIFFTQVDDIVSVKYTDIPVGEPRFEMYYVGSPDDYGFRQTYINGRELPFRRSNTREIEKDRKNFCFAPRGSVSIEFKGTVQHIVNSVGLQF